MRALIGLAKNSISLGEDASEYVDEAVQIHARLGLKRDHSMSEAYQCFDISEHAKPNGQSMPNLMG